MFVHFAFVLSFGSCWAPMGYGPAKVHNVSSVQYSLSVDFNAVTFQLKDFDSDANTFYKTRSEISISLFATHATCK